MNNNWKITYITFNSQLAETIFTGTILDAANFCPPNSNGPDSIVKIEIVPIQEGY